ncbi:HIT family hydrolase, diadenosine tetraphosphate hydrolase [Bernardetia litoralis DSM 6794]|uniref:HIT family hydrolase, diadenosine tetraphosphate hydrolase n=1 Tax=Bernardetia litoralis (strain ATCC 23117 / DSM 6794 / NBRC 15988 / NCIMB 1366 / Fx l1 / Sio-4) TaxID=880071 RepID=I4AG15_BERLS|nr:HIT family protein [Bernardetia litoralis]AFM02900.1 HIT family hydrolase, diadenosine tetraphosphate hydrolase [Bernardetia litoralis DSM 6794]
MSIFTKIINGEIPSYKILEDEKHLAFLDVRPLKEGHVLCVPKKENDYIFDLTDSELSDLMIFSKKVALALKKSISCNRIGVAVVGLEVPHTHVHLVPIDEIADLNFEQKRPEFSQEAFQNTAEKIRQNFDKK